MMQFDVNVAPQILDYSRFVTNVIKNSLNILMMISLGI